MLITILTAFTKFQHLDRHLRPIDLIKIELIYLIQSLFPDYSQLSDSWS